MARYIDADEAIKVIKEMVDNCDSRFYGEALIDAQSEILALPTADVAEVKHGEWELKSETIRLIDDFDENFYVECPYCKRTFYVPFEFDDEKRIAYARESYPYCNCGAKMDGGAKA